MRQHTETGVTSFVWSFCDSGCLAATFNFVCDVSRLPDVLTTESSECLQTAAAWTAGPKQRLYRRWRSCGSDENDSDCGFEGVAVTNVLVQDEYVYRSFCYNGADESDDGFMLLAILFLALATFRLCCDMYPVLDVDKCPYLERFTSDKLEHLASHQVLS